MSPAGEPVTGVVVLLSVVAAVAPVFGVVPSRDVVVVDGRAGSAGLVAHPVASSTLSAPAASARRVAVGVGMVVPFGGRSGR
jgi:hypothetical protein